MKNAKNPIRSALPAGGWRRAGKRGSKNPFFSFGFFSLFLLMFLFVNSGELSKPSFKNSEIVFFNPFFNDSQEVKNSNLFFSQNGVLAFETPSLIIQDNFIYGASTPRILTTQTLGSIFGESGKEDEKEVVDYTVKPGDTVQSVAASFGISADTLLWANNLSRNSALKAGQTLVILPIDGVYHIVKSGDSLEQISNTYKAKKEDILSFNDLADGEIYIGDIIVVPNGKLPAKITPFAVQNLADNFFILPTEGRITQHLHWYNAIDVANKCGTPIYAVASGLVQRAKYGWNAGGGNSVTILHPNGVVTRFGHLSDISVSSGQKVEVGERIGLMGGGDNTAGSGISTGCHLHFGVTGAKNPLAKHSLSAILKFK
ncbi:MAG: M23 family metallopeptidase [Patescibacteria group bacterium]